MMIFKFIILSNYFNVIRILHDFFTEFGEKLVTLFSEDDGLFNPDGSAWNGENLIWPGESEIPSESIQYLYKASLSSGIFQLHISPAFHSKKRHL